jgi:DNA-binding CsgD family transcriptional regulator
MRTGLVGVLSEAAAGLYERLVVAGALPLDDETEPGLSAAAAELVDKGFARERHVGTATLIPVEPARAIDNAIMVRQRQILDQYQMLVRLRDQMHELQHQYRSSVAFSVDVADLVTVVTDRREIGALSVEMVLSAEQDVASLETEHFTKPPDPKSARTLPAELVERGVRFRNIYSRAVIEDIPGASEMLRRSIASGWNCRIYPKLPMKMVVVDQRAALVPLGPTGMEGALVVRAPVVVAALRDYFELLWHRAVPAPGNADGGLPREQDHVLRLVLTGMTDAAIARQLDISERTVRRHVGALQERLGATNRVTLAVAAVRDGWLD